MGEWRTKEQLQQEQLKRIVSLHNWLVNHVAMPEMSPDHFGEAIEIDAEVLALHAEKVAEKYLMELLETGEDLEDDAPWISLYVLAFCTGVKWERRRVTGE